MAVFVFLSDCRAEVVFRVVAVRGVVGSFRAERAVCGSAVGASEAMTVEGEAAARISGEETLQQSNKPRQANGKVCFIGMGLFEV